MKTFAAVTLFLVGFAVLSPVVGAGTGDPGYLLNTPDLVGIGEGFSVDLQTPSGSFIILFASDGEGPTPTALGTFCLDFPALATVAFPLPSASVTLSGFTPCDRGLLGLNLFLQFVAFDLINPAVTGISNQSDILFVDNGRCP